MTKLLLALGAGPGIGLETARRFGREGHEVVLASRTPERLQPQVEALRAEGVTVTTAPVDLADGPAVTRLVEHYASRLGVLFYNAAALRFGPTLDEVAADTLDSDLQIDLSSALRAIKAALPGFYAQGSGTILLTGGAIADSPTPAALTLSAGKAGLRAAAQALFEPLKARNIHIGILTIGAHVLPESSEARDIATAFWTLQKQAAADWQWERRYP